MKNEVVLDFILDVVPRTKKNSQNLIRVGNRMMPIPSKLYREFEDTCQLLISKDKRLMIDYPVNVKAIYHVQRNARIDKTNLESALMDMLVKCEVLADDSALKPAIVVSTDGSKVIYNKEYPHIEITITKVGDKDDKE